MASTMGTARGSTHGSWRPFASSVVASLPVVTVSCAEAMVAVGLKATRNTTSSPVLMPPWTPPDRLVAVRGPSGPGTKASLWVRPVMSTASKPLPTSKPLAAGSDSIPLARSASRRSNTGAPRPVGTPRATQVTIPPSESPSRRAPSMAAAMASAADGAGQRVGWASTSARETVDASTSEPTAWTRDTQARTSIPATSANSRRAIAPAATRPMVSRALDRPPPRQSRCPYLAS